MIPTSILARTTDILTPQGIVPLSNSAKDGKRGAILVVGSEQTFFKAVEIPKGAKIGPDFIEINYLHLSPFAESSFSFSRSNGRLLLWFYKTPEVPHRITVPEGFLVLNALKSRKNVLAVQQSGTGRAKYFLILDGTLVDQFAKTFFGDPARELEEHLSLIKRKYEIEDIEVFQIDDSFLAGALKSLGFADLLRFSRLRLDRDEILDKTFQALKLPAILLLASIMATNYMVFLAARHEMDAATKELALLQEGNQSYKADLQETQRMRQFWSGFMASEYSRPNILDVMEEVAKVMHAQSGVITTLRFDGAKVVLGTLSPNTSQIIGSLLECGYFSSVTLTGSITRDQETSNEKATLEGILADLQPSQPPQPGGDRQ